jgi:hypothetical protein
MIRLNIEKVATTYSIELPEHLHSQYKTYRTEFANEYYGLPEILEQIDGVQHADHLYYIQLVVSGDVEDMDELWSVVNTAIENYMVVARKRMDKRGIEYDRG